MQIAMDETKKKVPHLQTDITEGLSHHLSALGKLLNLIMDVDACCLILMILVDSLFTVTWYFPGENLVSSHYMADTCPSSLSLLFVTIFLLFQHCFVFFYLFY